MRIRIVSPVDHFDQIEALLRMNWTETGFDFPLEPDRAMYQRMSEAGVLFALAAFRGGEIVGYCTVIVSPHLFNPAVVIASNDALFVHPDHRRGTVSGRLIREAEDEARRRGASRFLWHCRAGTGLARMLKRHGYQPADDVVMRSL